jgi:hypothetical protein
MTIHTLTANDLFQTKRNMSRLEGDLIEFINTELLPLEDKEEWNWKWSDFSYDHYDRSLELYECHPDLRLGDLGLQKLYELGFEMVYLNHSDGEESIYFKKFPTICQRRTKAKTL